MIIQAHSTTIWNNSFEKSEDYAIYITDLSSVNLIYHNDFIDNAMENDDANSQARDDGRDNLWSNDKLEDGNYWSDRGEEDIYQMDGTALAIDLHPHTGPVLVEHEYIGGGLPFSFPSLIIAMFSILAIRVIYRKLSKNLKRRNRSN